MRTELVIAALLGGAATYLIRLLPILAGERLGGSTAPPWLRRFLLALGPAAIAALLVLSLKDLVPMGEGWGGGAIAMTLAAAAVLAVQRLTRNPALATLAGAAIAALAHAILSS